MKSSIAILAAAAALALSGCGQLDTTPEGDPSRVLTGTIDLGGDFDLPADATATVRVVDASDASMPPQVLGLQTFKPAAAPIDYRVEYRADDDLLRRGLNIEARISYGGKVRFYNVNRYAVTLENAADPHRIEVVRAGQ
jgi:uncharacterized lipoprotein YbaY